MTRRTLLFALISLLIIIQSIGAADFPTKKAFIKRNLPTGSKMKKVSLALTEKQQKELKKSYNLPKVDEKITFITANSAEGKVVGSYAFIFRLLKQYNEPHTVGIALNADGSLKEVALVGTHSEYGTRINKKSFLGQFAKKSSSELSIGDDINAVSGATMSCQVVVDVVNMASAAYKEFLKK